MTVNFPKKALYALTSPLSGFARAGASLRRNLRHERYIFRKTSDGKENIRFSDKTDEKIGRFEDTSTWNRPLSKLII